MKADTNRAVTYARYKRRSRGDYQADEAVALTEKRNLHALLWETGNAEGGGNAGADGTFDML